MKRLVLLLALFCASAFAGNFGVVPNVGYLLTNTNLGPNIASGGYSGTLLIRGFSTLNANVVANHNSFDKLAMPGVASTVSSGTGAPGSSIGQIDLDYNNLSTVCFPDLVEGAITIKNNPVTGGCGFPQLVAVPCKHIYVSHTTSPLTSIAGWFPKVVTMYGAMVFSGDAFTTFDGTVAPNLAIIRDQLELDSMPNLASITLPATTDIMDDSYSCSPTADPPSILASNDPALASVSLPVLANWSGGIYIFNTIASVLSTPVLNNLGPNFQLDASHASFSIASVEAILAKMDTVATANYATGTRYTERSGADCASGYGGSPNICAFVDFRFQTSGVSCTGTCGTTKTHLISVLCPVRGNCVKTD